MRTIVYTVLANINGSVNVAGTFTTLALAQWLINARRVEFPELIHAEYTIAVTELVSPIERNS